jgi:uncharacterized protein YdaU (DUF1376 family)
MKHPWMPLYVADYLTDTTHLTTQQHGAYVLLMMRYWATGNLPHNDAQLAQVTRLDTESWLREKPVVLAFFNNDLTHKRIELELKKTAAISRKRSTSAKQRHLPKKKQDPDPSGGSPPANAEQLHTHSPSQAQKESGGGSACAREPASKLSPEALAFSIELAVIAGHDREFIPPEWLSRSPAQRVQMMLDSGWQIEVMREAATQAMRKKRDGPPSSILYFDKIFARAHAPQLPLPTSEVSHAQVYRPNLRVVGNPGGSFATYARDRAKSAG